ncbi:transposase [Acidiphilium multivorum]|uniref:transposase n=1 Tax=Acidiphilium multivorum TaxID=62140 RepID=UPI003211AF25
MHLKTDLDGHPLDFHLTGGEASDTTEFETSLDIGPDIRPRIVVTDKGYDSRANRVAARARGITPVIPRHENFKERGRFFPKRLYRRRARIERKRCWIGIVVVTQTGPDVCGRERRQHF